MSTNWYQWPGTQRAHSKSNIVHYFSRTILKNSICPSRVVNWGYLNINYVSPLPHRRYDKRFGSRSPWVQYKQNPLFSVLIYPRRVSLLVRQRGVVLLVKPRESCSRRRKLYQSMQVRCCWRAHISPLVHHAYRLVYKNTSYLQPSSSNTTTFHLSTSFLIIPMHLPPTPLVQFFTFIPH